MPIPEFESAFYQKIKAWIEDGNHQLQVVLPRGPTVQVSGTAIPSPDVLVTNPTSGRAVAIEIKTSTHTLPIGVYPQLKAMKDSLTSVGSDLVLVSTAPATNVLAANVGRSGISVIQASDPDAAFAQIEARLQALEVNVAPVPAKSAG